LSLRLLLDANLPHQVAAALREVGIDAFAPGDAAGSGLPPVPAKDAEDELICTWCEQTDAVLITRDRGKSDPGMKIAVAQHPGITSTWQELRVRPSRCSAPSASGSRASSSRIVRHDRLGPQS